MPQRKLATNKKTAKSEQALALPAELVALANGWEREVQGSVLHAIKAI